jgi:3-hydroxyisobutyrate dehydrogenase
MSDKKIRVGFIGLGIMGAPMALNILKSGFALTVFNRSAGKAEALVQQGAKEATSPRAVTEQSDVVITMVTDTPDVEEVLFSKHGVMAGARPGMTFVDMSTISPDRTKEFAELLADSSVHYLDAPVSGGDIGAREGKLSIMVGGDKSIFDTFQGLFEAMGSRITHVGPVGSGQAVKACNQILCAVNMVGVCEALSLASRLGLDMEKMLHVVTGGAAGSWALENLGPKIVGGDLNPGFMVKLLHKDLNIVMEAAQNAHLPLPGTAMALQHFLGVEASGGGDLGTQAMITVYEKPVK